LTNVAETITRRLDQLKAPHSVISSIDPFTNDGVIDSLPKNVSKAYAPSWWIEYTDLVSSSVVFAGDSGNDLPGMMAGYRTIVVANAPRDVVEEDREAHHRSGWLDRLHVTEQEAASGVLEGCRRYGLF
jgi:hydroxymethylpyrimidine pyrophosphatase-like HAD family hydrolase